MSNIEDYYSGMDESGDGFCGGCGSRIRYCECDVCEKCGTFLDRCVCETEEAEDTET